MATNLVTSFDFNRISTARLPFIWASLMALRTSTGLTTAKWQRQHCSQMAGSQHQAELRHVGAGRCRLRHGGGALLRHLAERQRDALDSAAERRILVQRQVRTGPLGRSNLRFWRHSGHWSAPGR